MQVEGGLELLYDVFRSGCGRIKQLILFKLNSQHALQIVAFPYLALL